MLGTASCKTNREDHEKREWAWPILLLQTHSQGAVEQSPKFECNHLFLSCVLNSQELKGILWIAHSFWVPCSGHLVLPLELQHPSVREPFTSSSPHGASSAWNTCLSSLLLIMLPPFRVCLPQGPVHVSLDPLSSLWQASIALCITLIPQVTVNSASEFPAVLALQRQWCIRASRENESTF